MAIALSVGYLVVHLMTTINGYWILLTTAFVCRPHYDATRLRLIQNILGTLLGLLVAWVLMQLFSSITLHLLFALLSTLVFILTRTERYMVGTTAVTAMALFCFSLIGDGFVMIWPRLLDTLIGCTIAAAAAFLILPDWQGRRLHKICAHVIDTCKNYLEKVLEYYRDQPVDDLEYRIARRDMNNADAALSAALAHMLREPGRYRRNLDTGFRFPGTYQHVTRSSVGTRGTSRTTGRRIKHSAVRRSKCLCRRRITSHSTCIGETQSPFYYERNTDRTRVD